MGMFIEQVARKCFHQSQSMLAATPHLPKTEMKMKAPSRGSQARKTAETGRSAVKHLSFPKSYLNDCTLSLKQSGTDFKLPHGHWAILWFEEGWDIFPAPLQKDGHHPASFTMKASVPVLGNTHRELFSHQESQIPLSLHQALPYIPAGKNPMRDTRQWHQHPSRC